jgi:hypothetical protein
MSKEEAATTAAEAKFPMDPLPVLPTFSEND